MRQVETTGNPRRPRREAAGGRPWLAIALVAAAWLSACTPMAAQVRELDKAGQSEQAAEAGLRWLQRHEATAEPAEVADVQLAVAKALFAAAARVDRHEVWRKARERMPLADATAEVVEEAYNREAAALYRDVTLPAHSSEAHRAFRSAYPDSPLCAASLKEEVRLAFEEARAIGTVAAWAHFRTLFAERQDAAALVAEALEIEAALAFRDASAAGTVAAWSSFCSVYPKSRLYSRALRNEIGLAFEQARTTGTFAAYRRFAEVYGRYPEAAGHVSSIRRLEVQQARSTLSRGDEAALDGFVRAYEGWPEAIEPVTEVRGWLVQLRLNRAVASRDEAKIEAFLTQHETWPEAEAVAARRAARRELVLLAFANAQARADRATWLRFVERFRGWPEAERELLFAADEGSR